MTVQLRSVSALASMCFLGLALTTATGCGAVAAAAPGVTSAVSAPNVPSDAPPGAPEEAMAGRDGVASPAADADPGVASKKLEVAGFQALVDQEKASLAAKGLSADDRAEHQATLAKLLKMKGESEAELAVLEKPFRAHASAPSLDTSKKVVLTSASLPAAPKLAGAALPASPKLPGVPGKLPGVPGLAASAKFPGVPGLPAVPALPGGVGSALGAASNVAALGHDPKGAAMGLAKLGASHVPGGAAALGAASAVTGLASDPKGAAKDLAKQGATAALNKVPGAGALKGSLFGSVTK
jgi:hypothetical protein